MRWTGCRGRSRCWASRDLRRSGHPALGCRPERLASGPVNNLSASWEPAIGDPCAERSPVGGSVWLPAASEGSAQVGDPLVGDLPRDEVAAPVVRCQVDVLVPGGAVTGEEVRDAALGVDPGRVLVADEGD